MKSESDESGKSVKSECVETGKSVKRESDESPDPPPLFLTFMESPYSGNLSFATAQGFTDGWDEVDIRWDEVEPIHRWHQNSMSMSIVFQLLKHKIYTVAV